MKIHKIELTKADLSALPSGERVLLIYAGHALNELNILCRLIVFSMPMRREEAERQFMVAQCLLFLRLLAGKLHEIWILFGKSFYKSGLSSSIQPEFTDDELECLKKLKHYFSKAGAAVTAVRNLHAFHYDLAQVDSGLAHLPPQTTLDVYFDGTATNTLYGFADSVINSAVLAKIDPSSSNKAFDTLLSDTEEMAKAFQRVLEATISNIIKRRLADKFVQENVQCEDVTATPAKQHELPKFLDNPGPWSVTLRNGKVLSWGGQKVEAADFLRNLVE